MLRIAKQNVLDSRKLLCNLISMQIGPAFAHGNLTLTKKMQSTLSMPKLFLTHGLGQFALMVNPLVPFQRLKIQTMISVQVNLAMFWAPSTDAEGLQPKQFCRWLILYLLNNHTWKGLKLQLMQKMWASKGCQRGQVPEGRCSKEVYDFEGGKLETW